MSWARAAEERTARLVEQLCEGLEPVRPSPRLGAGLLLVGAIWAALAGLIAWRGGLRSELVAALAGDPLFAGVFVGLALAAAGGSAAALAAAAPGREAVGRAGGGMAAAGLVIALAVCGLFATGGAPSSASTHLFCFARGLLFALLPGVALAVWATRGWVGQPLAGAGLGLVGAAASGALLAHLACSAGGSSHLLAGHVSLPIALALVAAFPVAQVLRRFAR